MGWVRGRVCGWVCWATTKKKLHKKSTISTSLSLQLSSHIPLFTRLLREAHRCEPLIRLLHTGEVYIVTQMKPTRLAQTVWIENGLIISSVSLNATPQPLAWWLYLCEIAFGFSYYELEDSEWFVHVVVGNGYFTLFGYSYSCKILLLCLKSITDLQ